MSGKSTVGLTTWLALLVVGAVVPLLLLAGVTLFEISKNSQDFIDQGLADTSRALALAVDGEIRSWKASLIALAASRSLQPRRLAEFYDEAREAAAQHEGWIVLTDAGGRQVLNTLRPYGTPLPSQTSLEAVGDTLKDGKTVVSDIFLGKVSQRFVVAVTVPVIRAGKVIYALTLSVGPEHLNRLLENQKLPASWVAAINDRQRKVVARSRDAESRIGKPMVEWYAAATRAAESGIVTGPRIDGRMSRYAFQRLKEVPWIVGMAVPVSELQSATPIWRFSLVGLALGLIALGGAVFIGGRITGPVRRLAAAGGPLVRGEEVDLGAPSGIRQVRELQKALVEASESIRAHYREREQAEEMLRHANEALEARVQERTTALAETNAALQTANTALQEDIEQRKQAEEERETAAGFLRLVNETRGKADLIRATISFFQEQSGCDAVGIRLKAGDDYPYFEVRGFPQEFVLAENRLCARDETGRPLHDSAGNAVLECMCGNVICGRFDPAKPFFTPRGSFWTNSTTKLLASTTEADRQAHTRNRCNGEGYQSVALLALRAGEDRLGLLQLNDRREGRFSAEAIALWERLAGYLSVALAKCRAEEELRESEERLTRAQRIAHLGSWELNLPHNRLTWSDEVYRIFGLQPQEFGATYEAFLERVHPEDRAAVDAAYSGSLRENRDTYEIEHRVVRIDTGEIRVVHEKCEHFRDASGQVVRSVGMVHDVTERKRMEEEIRALAKFPDENPYPVLRIGREGRILYANQSSDPILRLWDRQVGQDLPEAWRARVGEIYAASLPHELELESAGQTISCVFAPIVDAGYVNVYARDITRRKRAEEEVQRLNAELQQRLVALEEANAELESFSYTVSHDLRAPLRAIDGFSRILVEEHGPKLLPEAQRYLRLVRENTLQMGRLVDDLLAFSRLSRQPLKRQPVSLTALVHEVFESLKAECGGRRVELAVGDLTPCEGDPALLKQVLTNLLDNALKFSRDRVPARIEVGCQVQAGVPVYFIRDNGVGFDMLYSDKLFGVFQRLHRSEEYEGTGVGLAIVQRIIQRHGGRVCAEGEVGKGATFYFTVSGWPPTFRWRE